ncbi:hypothetical protein L7F22_011466 [Adiantum nelumboides]|nr:hypothetical protein [Adiantum nelumboides]
MSDILTPLDNYVSRSTEHFLTSKSPDYQRSLYKMISSLLSEQNLEDSDVEPAPKLIEVVLQNCKGRIDEWIEPYIRITVDRLRRTQKNYLKDLLIGVVANALYYNAALTLNVLQKLGATAEIFQLWLQLIYKTKKSGKALHFRREHDKKVCVLGLASLLLLPVEALPQELRLGFDQVFKVVLKLLVAYKEQKAESARKGENSDEDGEAEDLVSDEDEDWSGDPGDDDEEGEEVNSRRLQKLAAQASAFRTRGDDEDDESEDEFTDDEDFQAPIDDIDPFIFFNDALKGMSLADPSRFHALSQSLDFQHQAMAHGVTQHAEERRKELEKKSGVKASA